MIATWTIDAQGLRSLFIQEVVYKKCCRGWEWTSGVAFELLNFITEGRVENSPNGLEAKMNYLRLHARIFRRSWLGRPVITAFILVLSVFHDDMSPEQQERIKELGFEL